MTCDQKAREDFKINPSSCIAWYLMASYAYYVKDESLLSDETFDKLCKHIYDNWDSLNHKLKHLVPKESLTAGTGFDVEFYKFPNGLLRIIDNLIGEMK